MSTQSAALSSATQHTTPPEFGSKWRTECLNTKFPLPNLLCAGYSVKLKKNSTVWFIYFLLYSSRQPLRPSRLNGTASERKHDNWVRPSLRKLIKFYKHKRKNSIIPTKCISNSPFQCQMLGVSSSLNISI